MSNTSEALRKQLREAREAAGLSRKQLAEKLGISDVQVLRIENGTRSTNMARARDWMIACGYAVGSVTVGDPEYAEVLSTAILELDEDQLRQLMRVVRSWSQLPPHLQTAIFTMVEPYGPRP